MAAEMETMQDHTHLQEKYGNKPRWIMVAFVILGVVSHYLHQHTVFFWHLGRVKKAGNRAFNFYCTWDIEPRDLRGPPPPWGTNSKSRRTPNNDEAKLNKT